MKRKANETQYRRKILLWMIYAFILKIAIIQSNACPPNLLRQFEET